MAIENPDKNWCCIDKVYGCMDINAYNYNPLANTTDNSCIYLGCTDTEATNYDPHATDDDGSCKYIVNDPLLVILKEEDTHSPLDGN